ncbi:SDR family NAD(P)-dependent oxidoreductase [Marinobacter daepoensis]|uniref:SDR family NAD(P)-dependent oxidoreductase n=1 Tax=Marinobacter daepoensis TaxID=262077 RepID=A0ABS3BBU2_9GAMM|nr:SDR family NAD(P)-dependent oxidoreductase [Marinobacter daepoensis]MBN7769003.1 SDR family NAD(P)-dependent oxidoreductase [Marinobacter daepoensis]MBY6077693.1 SDR family NAD(P)-dependent oxidoreductase [Marinobacter daepoensis]
MRQPSHIWLTGASSGIGEALVHELAGLGHKLIVSGRRKAPLETLVSTFPDQVCPAVADTTNPTDLQSIAPQLGHFGDLDTVILNAGTCEYLDVENYDSQVIERNLTTNVLGTARCLDIALPALRATRAKGKPATLVIVSSSAWWFPFGRAEGYGASKAALTYFARSLRADLATEGIRVVVVSPGFVKTPLTDRNDFPMPFLLSAEEAARKIRIGLEKGRTDIAFPSRFIWSLKLLAALPQGLIDRLAANLARKSNH